MNIIGTWKKPDEGHNFRGVVIPIFCSTATLCECNQTVLFLSIEVLFRLWLSAVLGSR